MILDVTAPVPFAVPLVTRFRRVTSRSGVLVRGAAGWGEFSPFPDYGPDVTRWWWLAAQEAAEDGYPDPVRDHVEINTIVPVVDPQRAHEMVTASGCRTAKVKVADPGVSLAEDEARIEAVRDALGVSGLIRIDANAAWDVDEATRAIRLLERAAGGLEYVEQPCATLAEMATLRRRVDVPLAADESVRTAEDPLRIAGLEAADIVVVKVQPLGGVRRALAVIEAAGLPAVVSSAVETSVGLSAGLALAAALPELPHACGLGTAMLLAGDVVADPLVPVDGRLRVRRVEPEPELLERWAPGDPEAVLDRYRAAAAAAGAAVPEEGGL